MDTLYYLSNNDLGSSEECEPYFWWLEARYG